MVALAGELQLSESDLGGYRLNTDTEITIGEGDTFLSELLDKVVTSMREMERCYVNCQVTADGQRVTELDLGQCKTPKFNVTLLSFSRAADASELEADELLERAEHLKSRGVELYAAGNTEYAIKRFHRALDCIKLVDCEGEKKIPWTVRDRSSVVRSQCELNIAACRLKTEDFAAVIEHCSAALAIDPTNVKGLFRRSQALLKLGRYDEARKDACDALRVEPANKAVVAQLKAVDDLIRREKQIYQKMFSA